MRRLAARRQALADQIVAVLRDADGFPLSTGAVARSLGGRFVTYPDPPAQLDRPACWPEDLHDPGPSQQAVCQRCRCWHRQPVWQDYAADDVRGLLNRLARRGQIEKVVIDGARHHYWRRDDSDTDEPPGG